MGGKDGRDYTIRSRDGGWKERMVGTTREEVGMGLGGKDGRYYTIRSRDGGWEERMVGTTQYGVRMGVGRNGW